MIIYFIIYHSYIINISLNLQMNRLFILCLLVILIASKSQYRAINNSCTTTSCSFTLNYTGTDTYYKVPKNPIVKNLVVVFQALTYYDCTIKIIDANSKRF